MQQLELITHAALNAGCHQLVPAQHTLRSPTQGSSINAGISCTRAVFAAVLRLLQKYLGLLVSFTSITILFS
jgi:hypothetical protein